MHACIDVGCTSDAVQMDGCLVVGGGGGGKVCGMLTVGYEYTRPVLGHMAVWLVDSTVQCQWTQGGLYGVVLATGWLSWVPCIIVQIYTVHSIT